MAFPIRIVVAFATVTFVGTSAQGQTTWFVDDDNCPGLGTGTQADPFCMIQGAIDAAVNGDEVVAAPGTYVEAVDFLGKAITLRSTIPTDEEIVGATVIDGAAAGSVVSFQSDEGAESILDGLTITNGAGELGAGIYCYSSSPTIRNCMITDNILNPGFNSGGGICCTRYSSPTISDCTIAGNVASRHGGGIFCSWYSSPTISRCTISRNRAMLAGVGGNGGGIYSMFENSSPVITDCIIVDNEALHRGGGIYCGEGCNAVIADCLIARNITHTATSGAGGGGIYCHAATITRCTVIDNFGSFSGGGIISAGGATVSNCIISHNRTVFGGGGIEFWGAPSIVANCIIAQNSGSLGAGIAFQSNSSVISNCTITRNNGQDGGGVHVRNDSQPLIHNSIKGVFS